MIKTIFKVKTPNDSVCEYFDNRKSAIAFIIEEFCMALVFRLPNEGEHLEKYLETNNETPNRYPYKYIIEQINICQEFNEPSLIYVVKTNCVKETQDCSDIAIFSDFKAAREYYDKIVDEDIKQYEKTPYVQLETSCNKYARWFDNENYCVEHFEVSFLMFEEHEDKWYQYLDLCDDTQK